MSSAGVLTPYFRNIFVDGQESDTPDPGFVDCGPGRRFPMEATLDQIIELFYRVEDAWFIEGFFEKGVGDDQFPDSFNYFRVYAPTDAPSNRAYVANFNSHPWKVGGDYHVRGYQTPVGAAPAAVVPDYNDPYLGTAYDPGDGEQRRDITDNERGMWMSSNGGAVLPQWDGAGVGAVTNAFSFYGLNWTETDVESDPYLVSGGVFSIYPDGNGGTAEERMDGEISDFRVTFDKRIGVVKVNPTDSLFAPTNRFFIGVTFMAIGAQSYFHPFYLTFSTCKADLTDAGLGDGFAEACNYVIRLAQVNGVDVDLTCPIYTSIDYITIGGSNLITGSNFVHKAKSWWPCAKNSPAVPDWNASTGAAMP